MKKISKTVTITAAIFLIIGAAGCKRSGDVTDPSPFSPSTFATLLDASVSPNVIFAGNVRENTQVTVQLTHFDGTPIANKTILFEVLDSLGAKAFIGFFEGNQSVKTKTTDSNGQVSVQYFGPTAGELTGDSLIYIFMAVGWEGKEFITEQIPIYIIQDVIEVVFTVGANPNVVYATDTRPESIVTASFTKTDGAPLTGRKIFFTITEGPGYFEDGKRRTYVETDSMGLASIIFIGPTKYDIDGDLFSLLKVQPETTTPFYIHEEVEIRIIKEY
ncbi:MAG: hypothetical protein JXB26_05975 [Candidatus Aminicenantes bacterium]|nr:hypothetical protein [Candidatus Aminicenantes bacterium]